MEVLHEKPDTPERRRLQVAAELRQHHRPSLVGDGHDPAEGLSAELVDGRRHGCWTSSARAGSPDGDGLRRDQDLLEQHHRDMDAAGLGFDSRVESPGGQQPSDYRGRRAHGGTGHELDSRPDEGGAGIAGRVAGRAPKAWRPLVGILKRLPAAQSGPARRSVPGSRSRRRLTGTAPGALGDLARRCCRFFFREGGVAAAARDGAPVRRTS